MSAWTHLTQVLQFFYDLDFLISFSESTAKKKWIPWIPFQALDQDGDDHSFDDGPWLSRICARCECGGQWSLASIWRGTCPFTHYRDFFLVLEHYVKLYLKKSQSLRVSHLFMPLWRTKRTSESPYPGDASNVLYFKMATPLPPPEAQLWPRPLWSRISHERNSVYQACNRYAIGMQ